MANRLIHDKFIGAYVYAIVVDGLVRYIGKGRRYRAAEHIRKAKEINRLKQKGVRDGRLYCHIKLAEALRQGSEAHYEVIANNLSDEDALEREMAEIAKIEGGQLWNRTPGGDGHDGRYMKALWATEAFRNKVTDARRRSCATPEFKEQQRQNAVLQWRDPEKKDRHLKQHRALWDDPVAAAERRALLKRVWADPEKTSRKSALVKSQWTPERRKAMAENRRAAWADQEFKKKATENIRRAKAKTPYDSPQGDLPLDSGQPEKIQT